MARAFVLFVMAAVAIGGEGASGDLLPPVRIEAGGKPIDTDIGHAAPFVADFDGDGIRDLLVGQFGDGILWIFRNEGTDAAPKLAAGVKFKDGAQDGRVPTGWCVGFGPQLVDLDGDGNLDLLSGSWPGEIHFFKGRPGRTFAAPVKLRHKDGKSINIGGGLREGGIGGMILIAGDATFEEEGRVIVYEGERIRIPEGRQGAITGTASAVHAADWDGDGDYDLLVGEIGGSVYLVPNEGTKTAPAFGKESELPAKASHDAGPFVADWDGDGDLDLLVGGGDGAVLLYRKGGGTPPKLGEAEQLVPPGEVKYGPDASAQPVRGQRSKVCAADWNGDGRLDLLVGDIATQKPALPAPTPAEKAAQDEVRKELEGVMERYRVLSEKAGSRGGEEAERKKAGDELDEMQRRSQELRSKLPPEYEMHGWVWLFLRKGEKAARQ